MDHNVNKCTYIYVQKYRQRAWFKWPRCCTGIMLAPVDV